MVDEQLFSRFLFFEFITPQYENKKGIILLVTSEISIYLKFQSKNVVIARRHDEAIFKLQQAFY